MLKQNLLYIKNIECFLKSKGFTFFVTYDKFQEKWIVSVKTNKEDIALDLCYDMYGYFQKMYTTCVGNFENCFSTIIECTFSTGQFDHINYYNGGNVFNIERKAG